MRTPSVVLLTCAVGDTYDKLDYKRMVKVVRSVVPVTQRS